MALIGRYRNGNYDVLIFEDGTKVRKNDLDFFEAESPESMDIKITNQCDMGCPMCHEDSKPDGKHGDIMGAKFIETLHPYTELALGGGNPLSHPDLVPFLEKCKSLELLPSMTIHQKHFMDNLDLLLDMQKNHLFYGLGISMVDPTEEFMSAVKWFPNAVIHVINGIVSVEHLETLGNRDLKILILGYKDFRRGHKYYSKKVEGKKKELYDALPCLIKKFLVVSFDNLAIKQLDLKERNICKNWDEFYMGDDGQFTMYIDTVRKEFAQSSISTHRWPLEDSIMPMFEKVKNSRP